MNSLEREVFEKFKEQFRQEPLVVRSPGRINLIGEHTDYNDGFVMPAAIDKEVVFAVAPAPGSKSLIVSMMYNEQFEVDLDRVEKVENPAWVNYLLGVVYRMKQLGYTVKPFQCVFGGNVPMGAGMSSSAALECGFAFAMSQISQLNIPKQELVKIAQWSEHHFAGVLCGIMDQFASVMGKEGHVILLDCRSLEFKYSPIDLKDYTLILCDTKVKHSLVDSEYNTRRQECETGVRILQKYDPQVKSLRDVSLDMLNKHRHEMPGKVYNRCLYVVEEIKRVQGASADLEAGNLVAFGKKMYDTHHGLSALYEVSCAELDLLVEEAKKFGQVLGARMMGGGFGGCTINIVKKDAVNDFIIHQQQAYKKAYNIDMPTYHVTVKDGTSLVPRTRVSV